MEQARPQVGQLERQSPRAGQCQVTVGTVPVAVFCKKQQLTRGRTRLFND